MFWLMRDSRSIVPMLSCVALVFLIGCYGEPEIPADLVLLDGKVVTVDKNVPDGQAIAMKGDTILAVGSNREIRAYVGSETEVIDLDGKTVAFLGLSFKPDTDDTRSTRALPIIKKLYEEGATVKAYDPKAYYKFKPLTDLPIGYMDSFEEALEGADFAVVQSDWQEIKDIKPETFKKLLKSPLIIDGRRSYDPEAIKAGGVDYKGIGWKNR